MALRDLIPWSRQENRLPVAVEPARENAWEPHPLFSLHREVNRLFDDVFRSFGVPAFAGFDRVAHWPRVELGESDDEIRITAELPGLDEKDVEIMVEEGALTLRGEKRTEVEDRENGYSERSYGRFERRIALPLAIERDKAQATFRNRVLTVTLPRSASANANVRRISVNAAAA